MKKPTPAIPPDTAFSIESKHPYNTWFFVISHESSKGPEALIEKLHGHGFEETTPCPPHGNRVKRFFIKPGSGLFNGWTEEERKDNLDTIGTILNEFGVESCAQVFLTTADLL